MSDLKVLSPEEIQEMDILFKELLTAQAYQEYLFDRDKVRKEWKDKIPHILEMLG